MNNLRQMKKNRIIALIMIAVICCSSLFAESVVPTNRGKFHIYLLWGQSNMSGRGVLDEESQKVNPRVLTLSDAGEWVVAKDPIHKQYGRIKPGVGPGVSFARKMLSVDKNVTIGLVPCAVGGTPLRRWEKNGDLYKMALERARIAAKTGVISGVLWHQGEADSTKQKYADSYGKRLSRMVENLRKDLDSENLPVVFGQLGTFLKPERLPYADTVRSAIKNMPQVVTNTGFADSTGLDHKGDKLHFNSAGARELGARYAQAMQSLEAVKYEPLPLKIFQNLADGKKQTVLTYGTSVTIRGQWASEMGKWFKQNYPEQITFINSAKAGMTSKWGVENLKSRVLDKQPDLVFIEFAINDAATNRNISIENCERNLDVMVKAIRKQNPQVEIVLQTMNPAWDSPKTTKNYGSARPELAEYYDVYRQYALKNGITLVDQYPVWKKIMVESPEKYHRMVSDGIHPHSGPSRQIAWPNIKSMLEKAQLIVGGPVVEAKKLKSVVENIDGGGVTVFTNADTFLSNDGNAGPEKSHGKSGSMALRRYDGVRQRVLYFRFDLSAVKGDLSGATLTLNFTASGRSNRAEVFGVVDGATTGQGESWEEATVSYRNAAGFDSTAEKGKIVANSDLTDVLTSFSIKNGLKGDCVTIENEALDSFLKSDTDKQVTFAVIFSPLRGNSSCYVTAKDSNLKLAPRLNLPKAVGPGSDITLDSENELPKVSIAKYSGNKSAAISYTFDDGLRDQFTLAVPMLNEVGFKGTFFVIPGRTADTVEDAEKRANSKRNWGSICWAELKEMSEQGHEIASHTWSHPDLTKLKPEDVEMQLSKAIEAINGKIGKAPFTLAFPYNHSNPEVKAAALKYHAAYRAYQTSTKGSTTADSLNEWADKQVNHRSWGVLMTHGIIKGYAALKDQNILGEHWKYVKSKSDKIWVATFADIARYVNERDNTTISVTGSKDELTCLLNSTLDSKIYNIPLTVVIDAPGVGSVTAIRAGQTLPAFVAGEKVLIQACPGVESIKVSLSKGKDSVVNSQK